MQSKADTLQASPHRLLAACSRSSSPAMVCRDSERVSPCSPLGSWAHRGQPFFLQLMAMNPTEVKQIPLPTHCLVPPKKARKPPGVGLILSYEYAETSPSGLSVLPAFAAQTLLADWRSPQKSLSPLKPKKEETKAPAL